MELPGKRELREQILHQMDGRTSYVSDKDVYREIDKAILRSSHGGYGTLSEKEELRRQMFYSIRGFDVLEKYLGDSSISEIMVIGASRIFVEQNGKIRRIEEHFSEEGDVYRLIEQIVAPTNRMVNEACPIVDSRLPDGSRVHIVLPPVSLEGPVITIRKFLKGGMTIEKLLAFEEFPEKLTGILSALVKSRYNILISGATNSGKSSLLNALAEYIGKRERVITIEDSAELQLFHVENLVRLETRNANMEGENEITMRSGFTRQLFQYSVGGMLLIIVFACGFIWSAQTVRKIKQKNKSNSMNSIKDNINKQNKVRHRKRGEQGSSISDKFIQEKELQNRTQMIKTEVDWEAEGDWESGTEGTTILNYGNESEKEDGKICHPMLRDMELGIIYVIKNCPFYIGSAEGVNHLHIQDKTVSREHAVILEDIYEGDGQGYILRDMGSTNGTWLNGKKIKRGNQEQLEDGAVIRFAKKEYEFLIQDI